MRLLEEIESPKDLRKMSLKELNQVAKECRQLLIDTTAKNGGHLSSNLGVVELTLALHYSFNTPKDQLVWDVGHQAYVHKIITGRREAFSTLRKEEGLSGFPKRTESPYDCFDTGHSSTSISAGLGLAKARDISHKSNYVLSIIGDGALTGGMAYEALNNGGNTKKFIVVLNDNQMSISKNVGNMSAYLDRFRTKPFYTGIKTDVKERLKKLPKYGDDVIQVVQGVKNSVKQLVIPGMFFEELGYTYLGPIDGHDIKQLVQAMRQAKHVEGPVLLHVVTKKGKGYLPAEKDPSAFHGVKPFDIKDGSSLKKSICIEATYSQVVGKTLMTLAKENPRIVAITAAMTQGTGLESFSKNYPDRFFDVGIAEEHAVTFSAGLAVEGLKPFFVVYSSFLQRAYDQILHDVCLQNLPVVFCLDRAGLVGEDGETHQGLFDLAYLSQLPNMTVMSPRNRLELKAMLTFAGLYQKGPIAIRYPKGGDMVEQEKSLEPIIYGQCEWIHKKASPRLIISVGHFMERSIQAYNLLQEAGISCDLVNLRFIKPIDAILLEKIERDYEDVFVLEESILHGSVFSSIAMKLAERRVKSEFVGARLHSVGVNDAFVAQGTVSRQRELLGWNIESIVEKVKMTVERDETWQRKNV